MRLKMTERCLSDDEFVRRLSGHPELRRQMESLLLAVEDESGAHKTADAAELQIIEEMRRSGQVALQSWATRRVEETAQVAAQTDGQWSEGKKNSVGTVRLATFASTNPNTEMATKESVRSRKARR